MPPIRFDVRRRGHSAELRRVAAQDARRPARPAQRAPAPRRSRRRSAAVRRARASSTATTRACRASAPARSPSSCRQRLALPAEAISYEWAGTTKPVATNATAEGRAMNRRVEVEVWYDEIKQAMHSRRKCSSRRTSSASRSAAWRPSARCASRKATRGARASAISSSRCVYEEAPAKSRRRSSTSVKRALDNLQEKQNVLSQADRLHGQRAADASATSASTAITWRCPRRAPIASRWRCRRRWSCRRRDRQRRPRCEHAGRDQRHRARTCARIVASKSSSGTTIRCRNCRTSRGLCPVRPAARSSRESTIRRGDRSRRCSSEQGGRAVIPADYTQQLRRAMTDIADRIERAPALHRLHEERAPGSPHGDRVRR